jgi:aspartate/methionine/tyrosine aminotransferase
MTRFSSRVPEDLGPNALAAAVAKARAAGGEILDLTASDPSRFSLAHADAIAAALADGARAPYQPDPRGLASARAAVCEHYRQRDLTVAAERVVMTCSTSEACSLLFKLLCGPGDEVLIPTPGYPLFEHLAALEGVTPCPYAYGQAKAALGPRTRAVLAVSPANPTGAVLSAANLRALGELGVPLVCDEVFAETVVAGRHVSALAAPCGLTFALAGLSKLCAMPQLKLAWIAAAGPDAACAAALARLEVIADAYLSPATPVQVALPRLLALGAAIRPAIAAHVAANRATLAAALPVLPATAGWSAVVALPPGTDEEAVCLSLLFEQSVFVHPGYFFDLPDAHLVVSLLADADRFAEATTRLRAHVRART